MVFPFMHRLNPFTSARNSLFTGTRRTLILKYSAALSYAECADSAIILYNNIFLPWRQHVANISKGKGTGRANQT
jgi:hypothetical protein